MGRERKLSKVMLLAKVFGVWEHCGQTVGYCASGECWCDLYACAQYPLGCALHPTRDRWQVAGSFFSFNGRNISTISLSTRNWMACFCVPRFAVLMDRRRSISSDGYLDGLTSERRRPSCVSLVYSIKPE